MKQIFIRQVKRELLLHLRDPKTLLQAALFFLMVTVFFPLTLPADKKLLSLVAPGLIWIAMLLSMLLSSASFFQQDYEDGVMEQWLIAPFPLSLIVFAKLIVHWILNLIPILIFCPLLAILFNLTYQETLVLMLSLIIGSPAILFLCGLASAFSAGKQPKGILMALILLPLTIPIMIFGAGSLIMFMQDISFSPYLAILAAISLVTMGFLPSAIAFVLRINLSD